LRSAADNDEAAFETARRLEMPLTLEPNTKKLGKMLVYRKRGPHAHQLLFIGIQARHDPRLLLSVSAILLMIILT
jgi:hypothetical protein